MGEPTPTEELIAHLGGDEPADSQMTHADDAPSF